MTRVAVVAVGGNALTAAGQAGTIAEIETNAAVMAGCVADLVRTGWTVAVVHGNGPQVGNLALQQDAAQTVVPVQPLHALCAMTQGQLGSVLVRAVDEACGSGTAVAVVTHVTVDEDDPGFATPTKPIGPYLTSDDAVQLARERGWTVVDDSGRGIRRVVASPRPTGVVEMRAVRALLSAGHVVLAAGGGGVAVVPRAGRLVGMEAVVDKDLAAAQLATAIGAEELYLLTAVDGVVLDYGTSRQRPVDRLSAGEARRHLADGQFPPGSMGPKVVAAVAFLESGGRRAIITSAERLPDAVAGVPGAGTSFVIEDGAGPVASRQETYA